MVRPEHPGVKEANFGAKLRELLTITGDTLVAVDQTYLGFTVGMGPGWMEVMGILGGFFLPFFGGFLEDPVVNEEEKMKKHLGSRVRTPVKPIDFWPFIWIIKN